MQRALDVNKTRLIRMRILETLRACKAFLYLLRQKAPAMGRRLRLISSVSLLCAALTPVAVFAQEVSVNLGAGRGETLLAAAPAPTRMVARVGFSAPDARLNDARLSFETDEAGLRPDPERSWRNRLSPNVSIMTGPSADWSRSSASEDAPAPDLRLTFGATLTRRY